MLLEEAHRLVLLRGTGVDCRASSTAGFGSGKALPVREDVRAAVVREPHDVRAVQRHRVELEAGAEAVLPGRSRSLVKRIRVPSGEGIGFVSQFGVARIVRGGPPAAGIAARSDFVPVNFRRSKRIVWPSGIHFGLTSSNPPKLVRGRRPCRRR